MKCSLWKIIGEGLFAEALGVNFAQVLKGQRFVELIIKFPFVQYSLSACLWFNVQYSVKQLPVLQLMKQNLRLNNM